MVLRLGLAASCTVYTVRIPYVCNYVFSFVFNKVC